MAANEASPTRNHQSHLCWTTLDQFLLKIIGLQKEARLHVSFIPIAELMV